MKTTKVSAGHYNIIYKNQEYWIDKISPDDGSKPYWVWMKAGDYANSGYETKRDAIKGFENAIEKGWI